MSAAPHTAKTEPLLPVDKTAERPLWVVLIIMAFLAALALLSARIGDRNYNALHTELAGAATVQLKDLAPNTRLETAQQALALIKSTSAQSKTIAVFAQVGAADNFIARLFIIRTLKVGADNGLLPSLTPALSDIFMLAALCLIFALVCSAAAGVSAKQLLSRNRLYT